LTLKESFAISETLDKYKAVQNNVQSIYFILGVKCEICKYASKKLSQMSPKEILNNDLTPCSVCPVREKCEPEDSLYWQLAESLAKFSDKLDEIISYLKSKLEESLKE